MARCAYCDSDTNLYMNTVPVCRECDEHGYIPDKGTEANGQQPQTKTQSVTPTRWPLDNEIHAYAVVQNPPATEECWRVSSPRRNLVKTLCGTD